jgi:predicted Zn-dependent protease
MHTDSNIKRLSLLFFTLFALVFLPQCDSLVDSNDEDPAPQPYNHQAAPGSSAHDILSDSSYTALDVEIDYMSGYKPTDEAVNQLDSFLEQRLNKPSGVEIHVSSDPVASMNQQAYSADDIRSIEEEERDNRSTDQSKTLYVYMLIVDGEYNQSNVLGIAYYNTSMAFFGPTIHDNSGGVGQPSRAVLETTVFRHEAGHNMGLVNNGSDMQTDHQDDANGKHCTNDQCLMYYAVETTDYISNLSGGEVPPLDQNCKDDLAANGGK